MRHVRLSDVVLKTTNIKWANTAADKEFRYIDLSSVDRKTHTITTTSRITAKSAPSRAQKLVQTGDVLFGTTRPTLNRLCVVTDKYDGQVCSTGLCVLRANTGEILPRYIYFLLTTSRFMKYVEGLQRGTSYPAVTDNDVKNFSFDLPEVHEQMQIVAKLDAAFEKIDSTIELTQKKLLELNALKISILSQVFSDGRAE